MSEEQVVLHCSPTLTGIKPGSLFSVRMDSGEEFIAQMSGLNHQLRAAGVRIVPLKIRDGRALVYVYRASALKAYFREHEVAELLRRYGYRPESPGKCIAMLGQKVRGEKEFPHEVGLFLGYPAEDVDGFIRNQARGFKRVGTWKVYGDEKAAQKRFDEFAACTRSCVKRFREGATLRELTGSRQAM